MTQMKASSQTSRFTHILYIKLKWELYKYSKQGLKFLKFYQVNDYMANISERFVIFTRQILWIRILTLYFQYKIR